MSFIKTIIVASFVVMALSVNAAFALENGWYHAVTVQPPCGRLAQAVIYIEGDKPISATVLDTSVTAENPKKLTASKTKMIFSGSDLRVEAELSKRKDNSIDVMIVNGSACMGSLVTLSK